MVIRQPYTKMVKKKVESETISQQHLKAKEFSHNFYRDGPGDTGFGFLPAGLRKIEYLLLKIPNTDS